MTKPEPTIVNTTVMFDLDYGDPQGSAEDFGLGDDVTAQAVIDAMKDNGRSRFRGRVVDDWNLVDDPDIKVTVVARMSDGTSRRSHAEWSAQTDRVEHQAGQR